MRNERATLQGNIVAMRGQLQTAIDRSSSGDIRLRQVEDTAQQHHDRILEQLNEANQKLWHVENNAESRLGKIENRAQALELEAAAKLEATLQQQQMMQINGHQLEETLQQEKLQQERMQQGGRSLEETLQQTQLQQSQHQGRLHDQSLLLQSLQVADTKNQQLEAQLARIQQEKAESNIILSKQNDKMENLEELVKNMYESPSTIVKKQSGK